MSIPHEPTPVHLFFAVLAAPDAPLDELKRRLEVEFSPIVHAMAPYSFHEMAYYETEMGEGLFKSIWFCEKSINPQELVTIKLHTNHLEKVYSTKKGRSLNIDPGYMHLARVVLATGKDNAHRIYVGQGLYEEITLLYRRNHGFEPLPWTYPDYRREDVLHFFDDVRRSFHEQEKG